MDKDGYHGYYRDERPPQRTWVGLTDEDKNEILVDAVRHGWNDRLIVEQIEAKLKEKNT